MRFGHEACGGRGAKRTGGKRSPRGRSEKFTTDGIKKGNKAGLATHVHGVVQSGGRGEPDIGRERSMVMGTGSSGRAEFPAGKGCRFCSTDTVPVAKAIPEPRKRLRE